MREHIVPVDLGTGCELSLLGSAFGLLWPVQEAPHFDAQLRAIDKADWNLQRPKTRDRY